LRDVKAWAQRAHARVLNLEHAIMKAVKTYSTRLDADLAKIALDALAPTKQ
jgi:hypothetical protein